MDAAITINRDGSLRQSLEHFLAANGAIATADDVIAAAGGESASCPEIWQAARDLVNQQGARRAAEAGRAAQIERAATAMQQADGWWDATEKTIQGLKEIERMTAARGESAPTRTSGAYRRSRYASKVPHPWHVRKP